MQRKTISLFWGLNNVTVIPATNNASLLLNIFIDLPSYQQKSDYYALIVIKCYNSSIFMADIVYVALELPLGTNESLNRPKVNNITGKYIFYKIYQQFSSISETSWVIPLLWGIVLELHFAYWYHEYHYPNIARSKQRRDLIVL